MPIAVALSGLLYWGLLVYWVSDDLQAGFDTVGGEAAILVSSSRLYMLAT